jgi:hypothetical protein
MTTQKNYGWGNRERRNVRERERTTIIVVIKKVEIKKGNSRGREAIVKNLILKDGCCASHIMTAKKKTRKRRTKRSRRRGKKSMGSKQSKKYKTISILLNQWWLPLLPREVY